jgi:hypothetical protein
VSWNLSEVTVLWRLNGSILDSLVTNGTANISLSNGSNIMYFCSLFVKIWFCKHTDNLYAPCILYMLHSNSFLSLNLSIPVDLIFVNLIHYETPNLALYSALISLIPSWPKTFPLDFNLFVTYS